MDRGMNSMGMGEASIEMEIRSDLASLKAGGNVDDMCGHAAFRMVVDGHHNGV
jgi:hypothetical protein